jgi:hypothetical protein
VYTGLKNGFPLLILLPACCTNEIKTPGGMRSVFRIIMKEENIEVEDVEKEGIGNTPPATLSMLITVSCAVFSFCHAGQV